MAFSPPEYCRLFAQKKAYLGGGGGGVTGTPGPPPSYAPEQFVSLLKKPKTVVAHLLDVYLTGRKNYVRRDFFNISFSLLKYKNVFTLYV